MPAQSRFIILYLLCAALTCISACGGGNGTTPPQNPQLASITITSSDTTVPAGLTDQFSAKGNYSDGTTRSITVSWSTSDTSIATVDANGLVTTHKPGAVNISAASGGISGSTGLTVGNPNLLSITVSAAQDTVAAGLKDQFSATGSYSDSTTASVNGVFWSTSDTTVAGVNSNGLVTTHKEGNVQITAASGSISGSTGLTVGPAIPVSLSVTPGNSSVVIGSAPAKLSAILTYTDDSTKDVSSTANWSSSNTFAATVDGSGNITPV